MQTTAWHRWIGALLLLAAPACSSATTGENTTPPPTATGTPTAAPTVQPAAVTPPRADATLIKRQVLFGNPERQNVQLSPDGKHLSFLAPKDGVMNVFVAPADKPADAKPVTDEKTRGIRQYFWAQNGEFVLYIQDKGGDENFHLYAVDADKGGAAKDLTPFDGIQARMLMRSFKHPDEVLVGINNRSKEDHDVWRIHVKTGKSELVQQNDGMDSIIVDYDFVPRFAVKPTETGDQEVYFVEKAGKAKPAKAKGKDDKAKDDKPAAPAWKLFTKIPYEDALTTEVVGFDASGKTLYVLDSRGRDTVALTTADLKTAAPKLVAEDAKADIEDILVDPKTKLVQAVASNYERRVWRAIDKSIQADLDVLAKVTDGDFNVLSRTTDDKRWIVPYVVSDGPVRYYLYDRDKKKAEFLFTNLTALEKVKLAKMHSRVVKARDGLDLVSYLTLPVASDPDGDGVPDKPLPMVLYVHGGPWARDSWGLNPTHQWLANRGYAVLSVNYRGSTGFGKKFINAADKEWAGKMHDDLVDAVSWAVDKKVADKAQVAIMGGSYGGFATLVGLTFTPDTFACGVDIVGPSNLVTLLENFPPYWAAFVPQLAKRVGDRKTEEGRAFLLSRSPLSRVDKITKPLLIGQGANDPRVKQVEADQIVKAMKDKGIPVTYVLYPDEGHGFNRPQNRTSFYAVAETFLAQCLKGPYEPVGDDFKGSSIGVPAGADQVYGLTDALKAAGK